MYTEEQIDTSIKTSNSCCDSVVLEQQIDMQIDVKHERYPFSIVWTPIPVLSWIFPVIGHMGIAYSNGVIRDFAGSYFVSEGKMAFGRPTKYWQLDPVKTNPPGYRVWDNAIVEASNVYCNRIHNLICDNCHSHVALALNRMEYNGINNWGMVRLWFLMLIHSKYVNTIGILKTWLPFIIIIFVVMYCLLI